MRDVKEPEDVRVNVMPQASSSTTSLVLQTHVRLRVYRQFLDDGDIDATD